MLIQSYARGLSRGQKLNTMGAHHIRIVGVGSSNLLRSTRRKSPPILAVIFRLTTIIPQMGFIFDHFARTGAVCYKNSLPLFFAYL